MTNLDDLAVDGDAAIANQALETRSGQRQVADAGFDGEKTVDANAGAQGLRHVDFEARRGHGRVSAGSGLLR